MPAGTVLAGAFSAGTVLASSLDYCIIMNIVHRTRAPESGRLRVWSAKVMMWGQPPQTFGIAEVAQAVSQRADNRRSSIVSRNQARK